MAAETPLGVVGEKLTETATKQIFDTANKIVKSKLKLDKAEEKIQLKVEQGKTEKTQTAGRPGIQAAGVLESGLYKIADTAVTKSNGIYQAAATKAIATEVGITLDGMYKTVTDTASFTVGKMIIGEIAKDDSKLIEAAAAVSVEKAQTVFESGLSNVVKGLHDGIHDWIQEKFEQAKFQDNKGLQALCELYLTGDKWIDRISLLSDVADKGISEDLLSSYDHLKDDAFPERLAKYQAIAENISGGSKDTVSQALKNLVNGDNPSIENLTKSLVNYPPLSLTA